MSFEIELDSIFFEDVEDVEDDDDVDDDSGFKFEHEEHSDEVLNKSIVSILDKSYVCAIATSSDGVPNIYNAYFTFDNMFNLYFLSSPDAEHSKNIVDQPLVAVVVCDSNQPWGDDTSGLQLYGSCELVSEDDEDGPRKDYSERFPDFVEWFDGISEEEREEFDSRFYRVNTDRVKLFDEALFGEEVFIDLSLS